MNSSIVAAFSRKWMQTRVLVLPGDAYRADLYTSCRGRGETATGNQPVALQREGFPRNQRDYQWRSLLHVVQTWKRNRIWIRSRTWSWKKWWENGVEAKGAASPRTQSHHQHVLCAAGFGVWADVNEQGSINKHAADGPVWPFPNKIYFIPHHSQLIQMINVRSTIFSWRWPTDSTPCQVTNIEINYLIRPLQDRMWRLERCWVLLHKLE